VWEGFLKALITTTPKGSSFEEAADKVIAKLRARYPEKFSGELALNRDLVTERAVLEGALNGS
jgi:hypothetical protein